MIYIYTYLWIDNGYIYIWIWIITYKQKKLGTQALLLFKNADTPITNRFVFRGPKR